LKFVGIDIAFDIAMNQKSLNHNLAQCLAITALLIGASAICFAQEPRHKTEAEIRALIKKSHSKDYEVADEANENLSKLSIKDVPTLILILRRGETCERTGSAQLIVDLDRGNKNLIPVLIELSKGGTASSSDEDLICRRGATFLLAFTTEGIRVLTRFLKEGENLFIRQSAIFAFDELTETANYPEGSLGAMKEAIPIIAESGKLDDEVMKNMSNEVLWQIVRQGGEELSKIAKQYVDKNPK
jgi:hypothetical protein